MNITSLFHKIVRQQPGHLAVVGPEKYDRHSYSELYKDILKSACTLRRAGIREGTCVGLYYRTGYEYIVLSYAIWECGACIVPLPMELNKYDISHGKAPTVP